VPKAEAAGDGIFAEGRVWRHGGEGQRERIRTGARAA
jgi:hypothetical protein